MTNKKKEESHGKSSYKRWFIVITVLVAINLIVSLAAVTMSVSHSKTISNVEDISDKVDRLDNFFSENFDNYASGNNAGSRDSAATTGSTDIPTENEPTIGDEDAPVTIIEFTDYQCPFCKKYGKEAFPKIKEEYIDTGKVKYVFKDFPVPSLGHDNAVKMAKAANCAGEQGMYVEMHDKLFEEQNKISPQRTAKFDASKIDTWAQEIGLNMEEYNSCMSKSSVEDEINADLSEGKNGGVQGTPTFFINGEKLVGAQPFTRFQDKIESALNN